MDVPGHGLQVLRDTWITCKRFTLLLCPANRLTVEVDRERHLPRNGSIAIGKGDLLLQDIEDRQLVTKHRRYLRDEGTSSVDDGIGMDRLALPMRVELKLERGSLLDISDAGLTKVPAGRANLFEHVLAKLLTADVTRPADMQNGLDRGI